MSHFASAGRQRNVMVASGQPNTHEKVAPTPTKVSVLDDHNHVAEGTTSDSDLSHGLPVRGDTVQNAQTRLSLVGGKEVVSATVPFVTIRMTSSIYSL